MPLLDAFIRQIDLKDLAKRVAVRHAIEAERTDQQMHIQRIKSHTENTFSSTTTQNLAE
ncbi:hypothetical protein D3C80_2210590 [compost metagenome]